MGHHFGITLAIPSPSSAQLDRQESLQAIDIAKIYLENYGHTVTLDLDRELDVNSEMILWIGVERNRAHWPTFNRKLYISKDNRPPAWQGYHHQFYASSRLCEVVTEILQKDIANLNWYQTQR